MGNIFNNDFTEFLGQLNKHDVEYVLVGGYSVILHGYSRTTGDMDILVNKTKDNYLRLSKAFQDFGMPTFDMTENNFLSNPSFNVFSFGRQPVAIDIMTAIKGASFQEIYEEAVEFQAGAVKVRTIDVAKLIQTKKAAGRHKDLDDIENINK